MPKQILPILKTHAGRTQSAAECMFQIMNTNLLEASPFPRLLPCRVEHSKNRLSFICKHMGRVIATTGVDDRFGDAIENDQAILAIFNFAARDYENVGAKLRYQHFIFPTQATYLRVPAA